jgi:hypothetical protein
MKMTWIVQQTFTGMAAFKNTLTGQALAINDHALGIHSKRR